ncbi:MAG: glycosyltransferase [Planctomycetes bacterium]|nr:glycosyltransferase [Planctomycetota bacterium]
MSWTELVHTIFISVYTIMLVLVSIYGFHRYVLVFLYYRHRAKAPSPAGQFQELPAVTIQLPMYNEPLVVQRIIEKTCGIKYPREKLQVQVLDDSTDQTCELAKQAVEKARQQGYDVEYIHREDRTGYKAGALANGMKTAKGEFITIFDADFVPSESFMLDSIQYFTDPKVCVVQSRWDHLNRNDSMLTRSQALFLDGHFAIEHVARNRSERFMSFNGTAGTWRKSAIEDAGGWHHDTLTEDLDLSLRAQLKGWKFVFLPDLTSPAELPPEMSAFKAQQFRWTKGGAQTSIKLLPKIMLSKAPLKVKVESFFQLTSFSVHLFMMILVLLMFPAMYLKSVPIDRGTLLSGLFDISVFVLATFSAGVFYMASQYELDGDWRVVLKYMPIMMALGVGLCVSNSKAILEAWLGKKSEFVRTPKYGDGVSQVKPGMALQNPRKGRKRNWVPYIEMVLGVYMTACAVASIYSIKLLVTPFLLIFAFGFFYVSILTFHAQRAGRKAAQTSPTGQVESAKIRV